MGRESYLPDDVTRAVFAALGIDVPEQLESFTLHCSYRDGAKLEMTLIPQPVQVTDAGDIVKETKRFGIIPLMTRDEIRECAVSSKPPMIAFDAIVATARKDRNSDILDFSGMTVSPSLHGKISIDADKITAAIDGVPQPLGIFSYIEPPSIGKTYSTLGGCLAGLDQAVPMSMETDRISAKNIKFETDICPGCDGRGFYQPLIGEAVPCEVCGGKP